MNIGLADLIMGAVIVVSVIYSVVKGFIKEVFIIIAIVVGLAAATRFYPSARNVILPFLRNPTVSSVAGFLVLFLLVAALLIILGNAISKTIHFLRLGFLDRLLGGLLGAFKGLLICGIGCMIILAFIPKGEQMLRDSSLAPQVVYLTSRFFSLFPQDVKERLERRLKLLKPPVEKAVSLHPSSFDPESF